MKSTAPKTILRRNPDRTKRRLLQAAIRLFSEKGFHGISVDEIVALTGWNRALVKVRAFRARARLRRALDQLGGG